MRRRKGATKHSRCEFGASSSGAGTIAGMRIPLWLKVGWSVWVVAWAPLYWHQYGLQNFLYFCDLGNFFIAAALWLESPLLFSWQACAFSNPLHD